MGFGSIDLVCRSLVVFLAHEEHQGFNLYIGERGNHFQRVDVRAAFKKRQNGFVPRFLVRIDASGAVLRGVGVSAICVVRDRRKHSSIRMVSPTIVQTMVFDEG